MADVSNGGATGGASLILVFDLDHLAVGAGVTGLSSPLQKLLAQLPSGTQAALAWLPDLNLTEAQTLLNLKSGAFGAFVVVSGANGNELASTFLFTTPASGETQAAIGLSLDPPVDLAATPLFGPLLSGISITGFSVSYATQDFAAGSITLPAGAPSPFPAVASGFGLTFTVTAEGSTQNFTLPPASSGSAPSLARIAPRAAGADGAPAIEWLALQKSLGPLFIDRVGVAASAGTLGLALDASLDTDVVSIQLTGFMVAFSPGDMASAPPTVSLDGLAVAVDSGPLQIGGSLVQTQGPGGIEYDGSFLIRIESYAIDAAGSYTVVGGAPSLFVFGIAEGEFGGPPAFFVTGLAAGFGVNRALRLPAANQVGTFPLIEAAVHGPGGATDTQDALAQLNSGGWVPPTPGEYWVAAGVVFRQELVIALLGVAALQLPTPADSGPVFAYVEITLDAVLRPEAGVLSIEALLTPNSFVIDPSCQLTGGIAFDLWFGANAHAGDFVFTAGGYNPKFAVPSWYPTVPRLGFSWHISDALQLTGQSYFALTPSCVMGGGLLSLTFAAGGLRAWFTAQADFIMYWRPFFFDVDVSISIGISYTANFAFFSATFNVELGVAVELWGPPLRGIAHVNWWVISFDVAINGGGSPAPAGTTLASWAAFAGQSLPTGAGSICRARPASGMQSIIKTSAGDTIWLFSGDDLGLSTETLIPASQAVIASPTALTLPGLPVNVYPLANAEVVSTHQVCVAAWTGTDWRPGQPVPAGVDVSGWKWATATGNLPAALWGQRGNQTQPPLDSALVPAVTGITGSGQPGGLTVPAAALLVDPLPPRSLTLAPGPTGGPGPAAAGDTRPQVAATINDPSVLALRNAVTAVANSSGLGNGLTGGTLPLLAAEVDAVLTDPPMIGPPGTTGPPPAPPTPALETSPGPPAASPRPETGPRPALRALVRQDRAAAPSVTVVDRWSTSRDLRVTAGQRTLWPGMTAVWDLPAGGGQRTLRTDGGAPLWMAGIDAGQHVRQVRDITGTEAIQLEPEVTRVAVSAWPGANDPGRAGWQADTALQQIGSQTLVGEGGAIIRPQSPGGLPRRRSARGRRIYRELGVTTGRQLVERNWTWDADGPVQRGWIETHLPASCRTVLVSAVPASAPGDRAGTAALRVRLQYRRNGQPTATVSPAVTESHERADRATWRLLVPGDAQADGQLAVRVAAPEGWRLDGVYGFATAPATWASWPPEQTGPAPGRRPRAGPGVVAMSSPAPLAPGKPPSTTA
jgi:hypothetical protein